MFERILLMKLEMYVLTADKEIVSRYTSLNSSVFLCFIDASKAFDRICHETMFMKLLSERGP